MNTRTITRIVLMILVLVVVWGLYGAWYSRVGKESVQAADLASQITAQTELIEHAQQSKGELAQLTADQSLIAGYFVDATDIVPFLESLQSTGQALGSDVQVVSVAAESGQPHNHLELSLSITGTFNNVERTLGALEYSPRDITLTSLTLDTTGNGTSVSQWTAAATFNVGTLATPATSTKK